MNEQEQNSFSNEKTPQEELEELLQKTVPRKAKTGINFPNSGRYPRKLNFLGLGIILLVLVLLAGSSYLVLQSATFNTLKITFNLNEDDVNLQIDDEPKGIINSGDSMRVRAGERKLLLTKDGFLDLEERLNFIKGKDLVLEFELLPIPTIEKVMDMVPNSIRLNVDGSEISYFDANSNLFESLDLETGVTAVLFDDNISDVVDIQWSPVAQAAIVKLQGRKRFSNMRDNRQEPGRYNPLGERPQQAPSNFNGVTTWLFDDELRESSGWLPVLLTDNARQATFSNDGSAIIYIYEPSDGEYSLVRAWPDGLEWERVVVNIPRLNDPNLIWGADDRYLLIRDEPLLLIADLISKEIIDNAFSDRLANSFISISTEGDRVAYVATVNDVPVIRVYDLINETTQTIGDLAVDANTVFVWTDNNTLLVLLSNQIFKQIDIEQDVRSTIPLSGGTLDSTIRDMYYSRAAKLLLLITDGGVFKMRI
ncbi:hypothetical protein DRH29_02560 [candidate division Kazan bacterium]|uniref:PEGA domain-containing protein n=1 Tax=candidate division Kazan bacterium TaxID=2202143 RepID=A0A420ZCS7_UNCK3|nr:MAG: hypothetical protein DRH29_02560 [candidate division Kazan bacterium]